MALPPKKIVSESLTMLATAFGLVAALAWNEAVRALIDQVLPKGQGIISKFIYAIFVTIMVVIITSRLLKVKERFEEPSNRGEQKI